MGQSKPINLVTGNFNYKQIYEQNNGVSMVNDCRHDCHCIYFGTIACVRRASAAANCARSAGAAITTRSTPAFSAHAADHTSPTSAAPNYAGATSAGPDHPE